MLKKSGNQRGIALIVEVVLGALLLTLLGAGGYAVLQHSATKQPADVQVSDSPKSSSNSASIKSQPAKNTAKDPVSLPQQAAPTCSLDQVVYVTATDGLNLRSAKSTGAPKVIAIPYTSALQVGCSDDTWYTASYAGQTGYVLIQYTSLIKPANDSDLITAAIKAQDPSAQGVTNIVIQGDFAKCSVAEDMGGYAAILQKAGGVWTVIYSGQEPPSNAFGTSHGLPSGWYVTVY